MLEFLFNLLTSITLLMLIIFVINVKMRDIRGMRKFSAWFIVTGFITLVLGIINYII